MKVNGVIPFQRVSHRSRMRQAGDAMAALQAQFEVLAESHAALQAAHNTLAMLCIGQARVLRDVVGCDIATFDAKLAVAMAELSQDFTLRAQARQGHADAKTNA